MPTAQEILGKVETANNLRNVALEYDTANAKAQAVSGTAAKVALPALGLTRVLMLIASTRCHIRVGTDSVADAVANGNGTMPVPADTMFHMVVPAETTHLSVIQDSAGGFLSLVPVA